MLTVVTWLWDDPTAKHKGKFEYTAEHVNKFARMIRRNLSIPHEVVCITDRPKEITECRTIPLWNDFRHLRKCYTRLKAFSSEFGNIINNDQFVSIDLDVVITGELDSLVNREEDFIALKAPRTNHIQYGGAMWMMKVGAREEVWNEFVKFTKNRRSPNVRDYTKSKGYNGSDQGWFSYILGPNEATWDESDGIYSFVKDFWKPNISNLPNNARVVFISGKQHDASCAHVQKHCPWVKEYWK